jgi:hypothetical protein
MTSHLAKDILWGVLIGDCSVGTKRVLLLPDRVAADTLGPVGNKAVGPLLGVWSSRHECTRRDYSGDLLLTGPVHKCTACGARALRTL